MFLQPREIFFRASGVHDEQKVLVADPINNQVINNASALIEEKTVLTRTHIEFVDVVCEHRVEPIARARSTDDKLSHVRNIEDANAVSDGLVFSNDAGVLNWHEPTGEWNHFCAQPHMLVVKRRFSLCDFAHAP